MRCSIRPWRLEDAPDITKALDNKKVMDNLRDIPYPYSEQDAKDYINLMLAANPNQTYAFAITLDDKAIGSIGAFRQDNIHSKSAEIGYYLGEPYWGQGYGTEALTQICAYLFENTDLIRLYAEPFSHNKGSRRILEKVGFEQEGTLRSNAVKNGKVLDMTMYSLLRK